jgi:hypothetical protein
VYAVRVQDPGFSQDYKLMFFIRRKTRILINKSHFSKTIFYSIVTATVLQ